MSANTAEGDRASLLAAETTEGEPDELESSTSELTGSKGIEKREAKVANASQKRSQRKTSSRKTLDKKEEAVKKQTLAFDEPHLQDYSSFIAPSEEELHDRAVAAASIAFDGERYFRESWDFVQLNMSTFILVGLVWTGCFIFLELIFQWLFGSFSVFHTHHVHYDGVHYISAPGAGPLPPVHPSDPNGEHRHPIVGMEYQALHILSVFFHRVFVFYPALASFYYGVFNGLRNSARLVRMNDFFAFFQLNKLRRLFPVNCVLFLFAFVTTLQYLMVPIFLYFIIATAFVLPLAVDHPHVSTVNTFRISARVANSHIGPLFVFLFVCYALQLVGLFAFILPFYVAFPFAHTAIARCYHHIIGITGVKRDLDPMNIA